MQKMKIKYLIFVLEEVFIKKKKLEVVYETKKNCDRRDGDGNDVVQYSNGSRGWKTGY